MKRSTDGLWVIVMVAGMLYIPRMASAYGGGVDGGRITFAGAIVEPTCNVDAGDVASFTTDALKADASKTNLFARMKCAGSSTAATSQPIYDVTVVRLTDSESDRVLKYFNDYVKASQVNASSPVLVTQTYE